MSDITHHRPDGSTLVIVAEPRTCPECGGMRAIFVNRAGRTTCSPCDAVGSPAHQELEREWFARMRSA